MPTPPTPARLAELVARSRLADAAAVAAVASATKAATVDDLLPHLIATGLLTHFQAGKLRAGVWQGLVVGPFRILYPIARGGAGAVYLARDDRLPPNGPAPRLVALKLLPPKWARDQPRTLARFRREMVIGPLLPPHPHIARTLEAGEYDGVSGVAMEYVRGATAKQAVLDGGPMGVPQAARVFADVAAALHAAHAAGYVHRDTKPANVIVTPGGRGVLLDFGFALRRGERPADAADAEVIGGRGYTVGTMDYLPPEQASNAVAVGAETDVYSLGCSLYFALTGRPPFPDGTAKQKIALHRTAEPVPVRALNAAVPDDFAKLVDWLMAKRPEVRPQAADRVADELGRWATPPSPAAPERYDAAWEREVIQHVEANWLLGREAASDASGTASVVALAPSPPPPPVLALPAPPLPPPVPPPLPLARPVAPPPLPVARPVRRPPPPAP